MLALAQQYLDFINEARRLRLEIAADYLVMAAWLAFLKSKLLLPAEPSEEGEPTGAELAALLAFRLKRLDAMREVSAQLMTRKRLGRDVFARGLPEPTRITRKSIYDANVYDLLKAYSQQRQRTATRTWQVRQRTGVVAEGGARRARAVCSASPATGRRSISFSPSFWSSLSCARPRSPASFTATLEMTREGALEISQSKLFAPLLIRRRNRAA